MDAEEREEKMKRYKSKLIEFAATTKMTEDDLKNPEYKPGILNMLHFPNFEGITSLSELRESKPI